MKYAYMKTRHYLLRASRYELALCAWINRVCDKAFVKEFFTVISRLGDGVFWYVIMAALPFLMGAYGLEIAAHMLAVGLINLLIYKVIKSNTKRPRPYASNKSIDLGGRVLDQYSFPSGHTLHAVGFTVILLFYFPQLTVILLPFTLLVALSRVILGLHYPTDVLCGAIIGVTTSLISIAFIN